MPFTTKDFLIHFVSELNGHYQRTLEGLTEAQLSFHPNDQTCPIAFHAWHWLRTQDNILNFICQDRKPTYWMRQNLNVQWGLPKAAQGTGMDRREAQALRVPSPDALLQYARELYDDVQPYLETVSEEELQVVTTVRPLGEHSKLHHIGRAIIAHGNEHLGQIYALRSAQGLENTDMV